MVKGALRRVLEHASLFSFILISDLLLKFCALQWIKNGVIRISPFLNLNVSINEGVTWSLLSGFGRKGFFGLLILISFILCIFAVYFVKEFKRRGSAVPEILVLAGGIANLIDRFWHGGVVDFVDLHLGSWHWASFNVADICIVIGVALIAKRMLYEDL